MFQKHFGNILVTVINFRVNCMIFRSLGGETLVTILGGGFHSDTTDTILTVTIGGFTCNVVSQSYSKIECETSPRQVENAGEVIVSGGIFFSNYHYYLDLYIIYLTFSAIFQVLVNGVLAVCESPSGVCEFTTSEELTPFLSSVSPARNLLGDNTITIVGDRFSDNADEVTVRFGNSDCNVMSASVNQVSFEESYNQCLLGINRIIDLI